MNKALVILMEAYVRRLCGSWVDQSWRPTTHGPGLWTTCASSSSSSLSFSLPLCLAGAMSASLRIRSTTSLLRALPDNHHLAYTSGFQLHNAYFHSQRMVTHCVSCQN